MQTKTTESTSQEQDQQPMKSELGKPVYPEDPIPGWENLKTIQEKGAALMRFSMTAHDFKGLFRANNLLSAPFTEQQAEVLKQETGFDRESCVGSQQWTRGDIEAFGKEGHLCPHCEGKGYTWVPHRGRVTGVKVSIDMICKCLPYVQFYKRWNNPKSVPLDYRNVSMRDLLRFSANFKSFETSGKLESLVDTITQHPTNSYLLVGPHGLGKSTLLLAMYRSALQRWTTEAWHRGDWTESVWIANATTLSSEFRAWELRREENTGAEYGPLLKVPTIWESKINAAIEHGHNPCIFIEEFDKFKLDSDFQRKSFQNVMDKVHASGGQIVITSNLSQHALRQRLGEQYGGGIVRRVAGPRGNQGVDFTEKDGKLTQEAPDDSKSGFYVDFWIGEVTHPLTWDIPNPALGYTTESNAAEGAVRKSKSSIAALAKGSATNMEEDPLADIPSVTQSLSTTPRSEAPTTPSANVEITVSHDPTARYIEENQPIAPIAQNVTQQARFQFPKPSKARKSFLPVRHLSAST